MYRNRTETNPNVDLIISDREVFRVRDVVLVRVDLRLGSGNLEQAPRHVPPPQDERRYHLPDGTTLFSTYYFRSRFLRYFPWLIKSISNVATSKLNP